MILFFIYQLKTSGLCECISQFYENLHYDFCSLCQVSKLCIVTALISYTSFYNDNKGFFFTVIVCFIVAFSNSHPVFLL